MPNVLVGQQIQLTTNTPFPPPEVVSTFDIPLRAVCIGAQQDQSGWSYIPATPLLNNTWAPVFYFIQPGTYVITNTVILPGAPPQSQSLTFVVTLPIGTITTSAIQPSLIGDTLALGSPAGISGCVFTAVVSNPCPDFSIQIGFVQVVNAQRYVTKDNGANASCPINGNWTLDADPAVTPFYASNFVTVNNSSSGTISSDDSPSLPLSGMGGLASASVQNECFITYICYRTDPNSIIIPLAAQGWQWSASASNQAGNWQLTQASSNAGIPFPAVMQQYSGSARSQLNLEWGDWSDVHEASRGIRS